MAKHLLAALLQGVISPLQSEIPMTRLLLSIGSLLALSATAQAQSGFRCQAFRMQPNGMLAVVQTVTITGTNGQVSMNPGTIFGPGVMMGLNIYEMYRQSCR
jgi:hypothetical protein